MIERVPCAIAYEMQNTAFKLQKGCIYYFDYIIRNYRFRKIQFDGNLVKRTWNKGILRTR